MYYVGKQNAKKLQKKKKLHCFQNSLWKECLKWLKTLLLTKVNFLALTLQLQALF